MTLPTINLYNTMTRHVEPLQPIVPGEVGLYCCGPTVYNYPHIGNMRTYVFEDLLVRTLRTAGYRVRHVMNITDVGHLVSDADEGEDKMLVAVRREGKSSYEIAKFYTDVFFDHAAKLNILRPDVVCNATDHVPQMVELTKRLEDSGFAYRAAGNVYFDVSKLPDYGKLARLNLEQLQAGARIEVDQNKKNPLDFALWFTKSKFENQEMQWDSPWGRGYPGWHIECSAMSMFYLGETFDIHCGGIDHISVHHTNEIAQSEAATGKTFSKIWMHAGFLVLSKDKMSKSSGEILTVDSLVKRDIDPLAYRLFCLAAHYRGELAFSWEAVENYQHALRKLQNAVLDLREAAAGSKEDGAKEGFSPKGDEYWQRFCAECYQDLSFPTALAIFHEVLGDSTLSAQERWALLCRFDQVLGLGVADWSSAEVPAEVLELAQRRNEARKAKNWSIADALRQEINERGYEVEDAAQGFKIKKR